MNLSGVHVYSVYKTDYMRLLILIFLVSHALYASEVPTPIVPKTQIIQNQAWYAEQTLLWKKQALELNRADDWMNYYLAARFASASDDVLQSIVDEMTLHHSNSAESAFVNSWQRGFVPEAYPLVVAAHASAPGKATFFPWLVMQHEFNFRRDERKQVSKLIYNGGSISTSLLHYSYNVLMSLEKNCVLITDGENTTVPLYILQDVLDLRSDVTIINLDMILHTSYRSKMIAASGLGFPSEAPSKAEMCASLPQSNKDHTFYYALTLGRENIAPIKDQLYVVGLASQISEKRIDNISIIKNNLENRFLMDYLTVDFNGESPFAAGKVLSANYLVPMLLLDEHYRSAGENEKAQQLEFVIRKLAEESGRTLLVDNFLKRKTAVAESFVPFKLDLKAIEGKLKLVKDKIYANEYEVTNGDYNEFLSYLQDNKLSDLYEQCKIQLDQYDEPALSFMRSYHTRAVPTKKNKYFSDYPVVNVSFEAATAYCDWLTKQYNHTPDRKYKKVIFRLPKFKEWQLAAVGFKNAPSWNLSEIKGEIRKFEEGREIGKKYESVIVTLDDPQVLYPWWGVYALRNSPLNVRGCSLGNFKFPPDVRPCRPDKMATPDGFFMMSNVGVYFPNAMGLYDVVGNVAEMSDEKGSALGGSWNHPPEESTIKSVNQYSAPGAEIGFRVFMEVLE